MKIEGLDKDYISVHVQRDYDDADGINLAVTVTIDKLNEHSGQNAVTIFLAPEAAKKLAAALDGKVYQAEYERREDPK